jgi:hypothetical protein
MTRTNVDAKLLLNPKNCILKAKRIAAVEIEIDEIKENIKFKIWNDTEDHTKGMHGDKMYMSDKERQKRGQEIKSTGKI